MAKLCNSHRSALVGKGFDYSEAARHGGHKTGIGECIDFLRDGEWWCGWCYGYCCRFDYGWWSYDCLCRFGYGWWGVWLLRQCLFGRKGLCVIFGIEGRNVLHSDVAMKMADGASVRGGLLRSR